MAEYHAMAGTENIVEVADRAGFSAHTLWNLPQNQELKERRKYMNLLAPGDVLYIPDLQPFTKNCAMDSRHIFRRKGIPAIFRLRIMTDGVPKANMRYTLTVGHTDLSGVTDADGVLEQHVPPDASDAQLLMEDRSIYCIQFGGLNPASETTGVQTRLNNLGFTCGDVTGIWNDATTLALRRFQARVALPETGKLDPATAQKLQEIHDMSAEFRQDLADGE
jgi:hypothetical protein